MKQLMSGIFATKIFSGNILMAVAALLMLASCGKDREEPVFDFLVEAQSLGTVTAAQLKTILPADYAALRPFVSRGINVYRVTYNTSCNNSALKASGLFIIPENGTAQTPALIYNHGTIGNRTDALSRNSVLSPTAETTVAYLSASVFGCAALVPDYIGYGVSEATVHPYIHAESLGQSSLDFFRTYVEYAEQIQHLQVSRKVVIVGYSEGGYASVALHKKIQESAHDIQVVKTYAGAGPYDLNASMKETVAKNEDLGAVHLSSYLWVLSTLKTYMDYSKPFDRIFSEQDNAIFQNSHYDFAYLKTYPDINHNSQHLFTPGFISGVAGADTELSNIMEQNSLVNFVPSDSLILFHSEADAWVYPINTTNAYNRMKSQGAPVRSEIVPMASGLGHEAASAVFLQSTFTNILLTNVFGN
jgi:predicted esterase